MLTDELSIEEIAAIRYNEGREDGWEGGLEKGLERGRYEGREEGAIVIARNALAKGSTPEFVQEITGLNLETIQGLGS
jgi:predicted transposase YdaD